VLKHKNTHTILVFYPLNILARPLWHKADPFYSNCCLTFIRTAVYKLTVVPL